MEPQEESGDEQLKVLTFGCRLNAFESEVMLRKAKEAGLQELEDGAILVNTCAVTGEAVRQAKQAIRRARRENPNARIVVSGCAAQTEAQTFGDMDEVDLVIGNEEKLHSQSYRALPITRSTSSMSPKVCASVCAAQPETTIRALGFSRRARRVACFA